MYDGNKMRRDACSAVGTVGARKGTRFQRCWRYGAALDAWTWSLVSARDPTILTYWPEGRRRGRAGGRQEYRHFASWRNPGCPPSPGPGPLRTSCRVPSFARMTTGSASGAAPPYPIAHPTIPARDEVASHVEAYHRSGDVGMLLDQLRALRQTHAARRAQGGSRRPIARCRK